MAQYLLLPSIEEPTKSTITAKIPKNHALEGEKEK
jgi:hypothetical protein